MNFSMIFPLSWVGKKEIAKRLMLLSGATMLSLLTACVGEVEDPELKKEVDAKSERLEGLKRELSAANDEVAAMTSKISDLENSIRSLPRLQKLELETTKEFNDVKDYESNLNAAIQYLDARLLVWKTAARKSMVGRELGGLVLVDGTSLAAAVVSEVTDGGVRVRYQGGDKLIPFDSLPIPLREELVDEGHLLTKRQLEEEKK